MTQITSKSGSLLNAVVTLIALLGSFNSFAQSNKFTITSNILSEDRNIVVHLPNSYLESKQHYPVVYILDAGNDDQLLAETINSLATKTNTPEAIVIAIENIRRGYDFTAPYETFGPKDNRKHGNANKFLAFVKNELIPRIKQQYRTTSIDFIVGHSWGAAFTSFVLSKEPELFDGYVIFSPTFFFQPTVEQSTQKLFEDLDKSFSNKTIEPKFIYISVGENEGERFKSSYHVLVKKLQSYSLTNTKLKHQITPNADHMENPEVSLEQAIEFAWNAAANNPK